jgi:hypothetical protein
MRWYRHGDSDIIKQKYHGYSNHSLYKMWIDMKSRCYNKNFHQYKDYGERGIRICNEWKNDAKIFIEWAISLWKKGLQIDRKNNNGNYCPENCRFVTRIENIHNTRLLYNHNTSGYRGVYYYKNKKKWAVQISINNKQRTLGYFDSPRLAALRYDVEAYLTDNRSRNFF